MTTSIIVYIRSIHFACGRTLGLIIVVVAIFSSSIFFYFFF